jgi:hypothetical protein
MKAMLAAAALSALVGGCATTIEAGPGYYRYDTHAATVAPPVVVADQPVVTYRQPAVVVREPTVIYREPAVVYRSSSYWYHDHGQ